MNIYLETYGCTANKSDEAIIRGLLQKQNCTFVDSIEDADQLILLTCTVIGTTEQRMLSRLRAFKKTRKPIIVTGCMPTVQADLILSIAPEATLLLPHYIHYITEIMAQKKPAFTTTKKTLYPKTYTGVIAPLSIAEGCNLACSYCITHLTRGTLRSFPIDEIVVDVRTALSQGCKEIQLTAQDTASYGLDTRTNLGALLSHVVQVPGEYRLRVGMMNPLTLKKHIPEILPMFAHPKLYRFLHLPVQSGDNDILRKMKRGYTIDEFLDIVSRFRTTYPDITLSTDIIVGFPTETDHQFQRTLQLIKDVKPDITNITRFSARPSTAAKTMKGRVPTDIVKIRSSQLAELCSQISLEKNRQHLGKIYTVLVTEKGKRNTMTGRTATYKQVVLKEPVQLGTFVETMMIDATPTHLVGNLI